MFLLFLLSVVLSDPVDVVVNRKFNLFGREEALVNWNKSISLGYQGRRISRGVVAHFSPEIENCFNF